MDLYHVDIRLPAGFTLPARSVNLHWTRHADHARTNDRYAVVPWTYTLNLGVCRVVEVGMTDGHIAKIVVRTSLDSVHDVVYVLIPGPGAWVVKTVWINEANDSHKTLDRSKYVG